MRLAWTSAGIVGLIATLTMMSGSVVPLAPQVAPPAPPGVRAATTYHYAEAIPQALTTQATGAVATFTVHHPQQVGSGSHSLAELAVAPNSANRTYVEAGWTVEPGRKTRLFVFWWRAGVPHCYNFGCGFVDRGNAIRPGTALKAGTSIRLAWKHKDAKWWLFVNGRQSGYYPDRLWDGNFTGTKWFQLFGEVANGGGRLCEDMGTGRFPADPASASVTDVAYLGGPAVTLSAGHTDDRNNYRVRITSADSFHFGGPGNC